MHKITRLVDDTDSMETLSMIELRRYVISDRLIAKVNEAFKIL